MTTDGAVTDYEVILKFIIEMASEVQLREVAYDPWQSLALVNRLDCEGIPVVKVPQVLSHLSPATKELKRLVLSGELVHDGNPMFAWMVNNVAIKEDSNENQRPDKKKSTEKIDGDGKEKGSGLF